MCANSIITNKKVKIETHVYFPQKCSSPDSSPLFLVNTVPSASPISLKSMSD